MMLVVLIPLLALVGPSYGITRHYFIAAVEMEWNYAPDGPEHFVGLNSSASATYWENVDRPDRIGTTYKKALYREYTDSTFTAQKPHPEWLGVLGPIVRAQVGDQIQVHFKNLATRPYSVHPHGVFYEKDSEGAAYKDGTSGQNKADERVPPGDTFRYVWEVPQRAGPSQGDAPCISWQYHSHISSPSGTNTGLVGPVIICRRGFLNDDGSRVDVDKEFFLFASVQDENLSYYIEDNINTYCTDSSSVDVESDEFYESNRHMTFNGYIYSNLPGLEVCVGEKVAWHILGMGTEIDLHTITFMGNELYHDSHRKDDFSVSPAIMYDTTMRPRNPGTWLIVCNVLTHVEAGLSAMYRVRDDCGWRAVPSPLDGQLREYSIAAVNLTWDYAPTGLNQRDQSDLTDPEREQSKLFESNSERIGGLYRKLLFRKYSDASFTRRVKGGRDERHLGMLGPIIRAEVGDTIRVHFKNMANRPLNLHADGVTYNKSNEGIFYNDGTSGRDKEDDMVLPGSVYVYEWTVPDYMGPTARDPQCLTKYYRSTLDWWKDFNSGLIGPVIICKAGTLDENGKQMNVDKEYVLLLTRIDENESWLIDHNIAEFAPSADKTDDDFIASNDMEVINGWSYSNAIGLEACKGDTISWHLIAIGRDFDHHSVYFHGASFLEEGKREDSVGLQPGITSTVHMTVRNEGLWAIDCLTVDHFVEGMQAQYQVNDCRSGRQGSSTEEQADEPARTYYIAAVEVNWDYTPNRFDPVRNESLDDPDSEGHVFVVRGETSIGSTYKKAVFREFTDASFLEEKPRPIDMGLLGPPVYIEDGESVQIVFKNLADTRSYSIHCHLVTPVNSDDGFHIEDDDDVGVGPGETRTYTWKLPRSSAPASTQSRCEPFIYYSGVDFEHDLYSGLVGPLIACRKGTLNEGGVRDDIDRELFLLFMVVDENKSWYLQDNIDTYCTEPSDVDTADPDFEESNLMHGINGFLYGNLRGLNMELGQTVEWYLLGMGSVVDLHTVHFHGQTITYRTEKVHRSDVFELLPGVSSSVRMRPDDPGEWLLHCHVNDHILGGMEATFIVTDPANSDDTDTPADV